MRPHHRCPSVGSGLAALVLLFVLGAAACRPGNERPPAAAEEPAARSAPDDSLARPAMPDAKLDAALRNRLRGADAAAERVAVFVETDGAPSEKQRAEMVAAGLSLGTVSGHVVTAHGTPEAIERAAFLPFVRSIALSQTRPPLER